MSNPKAKGEKGQKVVIGELAKHDIEVLIPLSDNLPYDLVIDWQGRLLKCQVKSSDYRPSKASGMVEFSLKTNNWYKKTSKTYSADEIDVMLLCDLRDWSVYVLGPKDFDGRSSFAMRDEAAKNGQKKGVNLREDYLLSEATLTRKLSL